MHVGWLLPLHACGLASASACMHAGWLLPLHACGLASASACMHAGWLLPLNACGPATASACMHAGWLLPLHACGPATASTRHVEQTYYYTVLLLHMLSSTAAHAVIHYYRTCCHPLLTHMVSSVICAHAMSHIMCSDPARWSGPEACSACTQTRQWEQKGRAAMAQAVAVAAAQRRMTRQS